MSNIPGLALILCVWLAAPGWGGSMRVAVYHTNDIHGWIMPRPARQSKRLVGGAAALTKLYRSQKGLKILLDGGDWFQGAPEGTIPRGRALADIFNAVPYDAVVVGNHDFDFGEETLKTLVRKIKIPVLGANVYRAEDRARVGYLSPWIVKEVGGIKIGIFGLLMARMRQVSFPRNIQGLEFRREVDEARDAVAALRGLGASVIIAVTHMGFETPDFPPFEGDQTLAGEVEGIDLIVGGHSHTALAQPLHDATHGTWIAQAGGLLTKAGRVTLTIDSETKKVTAVQGELIDLWVDEIGQDAQVLGIVEGYASEVGKGLSVVVATAGAALERNRQGESSLGDWMTDCMREWAEADAAFQNSGGIRSEMPQGPVTLRTLFDIMPFENIMVKLQMSGRLIRQVLEKGDASGNVMQFSGLKVFYNRRRPAGKRVESVSVAGRPLQPEAAYSVAVPDFLAGHASFAAASRKEYTDKLARDVLGECARKHPRIERPAPGRMSFREN